jgi:hypothetical protein
VACLVQDATTNDAVSRIAISDLLIYAPFETVFFYVCIPYTLQERAGAITPILVETVEEAVTQCLM